mgnify:CR=1 FL=1
MKIAARMGLIALLCALWTTNSYSIAQENIAGIASVIDGDTIQIHGRRIRLFGIDAPESQQFCFRPNGEPWRCGQQASFALAELSPIFGDGRAGQAAADSRQVLRWRIGSGTQHSAASIAISTATTALSWPPKTEPLKTLPLVQQLLLSFRGGQDNRPQPTKLTHRPRLPLSMPGSAKARGQIKAARFHSSLVQFANREICYLARKRVISRVGMLPKSSPRHAGVYMVYREVIYRTIVDCNSLARAD